MDTTAPTRRSGTTLAPALAALLALGLTGGALEAQNGPPERAAATTDARRALEDGRLVGRVLSSRTAEPLSSAQVHIPGLDLGTLTAVDGRYVLRGVPPGTHTLRVEIIGYGARVVTDVEVRPGETTELDVTVSPRAVEVEGLTVSASAQRGSTTSLLVERRLSNLVSDAIGSDQMARTPDGDAAAALKRVPGLSVVDGKFAYVRGLGERYSSTTLNGAPLASPVPDRKVIPLDVIPSSLLESIVTSKSYSPDQPGDYAGGLVQLRTRAFPSRRIVSVSAGTGWNSVSTLRSGLGYDGAGGLGFLGLAGEVRGLPDAVPSDRRVSRGVLSADQLQRIGRSFGGDWGPTEGDVPLDASFGATLGDAFDLDDGGRFAFVASANYASSHEAREGWIERVFSQANVDDPEVDYRGELTRRSVSWGGLLNLTLQPRPSHQVSFSGLYNRLADDNARRLQGFNLDSNTDQLETRLQYVATSLTNLQLEGRHLLGFLGDADLTWRGAWTRATRWEPDTRDVLYRRFGERFVFDDFLQSGSIFHQDMSDDGWSGATALEIPLGRLAPDAGLRVGVSTDRKERSAFTRRFRFRPGRGGILTDEVLGLSPNELLSPEHIAPDGFEIQESTFRTDNYDADETIDAAYLTATLPLGSRLRVHGGARIERASQVVVPRDLFETGLEGVEGGRLEATDVMPAINVTLALGESTNLRWSASRTLARPQLRELAPFSFADYAGGYLVVGNPTLDRARITNTDLRWEWFPDARSVIAVSGFYKSFDDPIEVLALPSTELIRSWVNAEGATNHGVELELRAGLGFVAPALEALELNGNLTLVASEVSSGGRSEVYIPGIGPTELNTIDRDRPLQGQSPYVVNLGLTWFSPAAGASASVLFNRFGERIDAVGREASPDIYEEARSQLDLVVERAFGEVKVKLAATRLVGGEVAFTQGGELLRTYDLGRSLSLSLGWSPAR